MNHHDLGSTYRVQVQALGFDKTRLLVPYLAALGIQTLYLSPVFAAAPGSTHGYDVIDPQRLDPVLGTEREFESLLEELEAHGMHALLDIVPNHMAAVPENAWWWDVLRSGKSSVHASTFDIQWSANQGRVLVPVLVRPLSEVFAAGEVRVDPATRELQVDGIRFPLAVSTPSGDGPGMVRHQHYRPAYWRASATQGNYRRFFDINSLIGVRVEDPEVFAATHALVAELGRRNVVAGVRVDHIDGLTDPARYLWRLRELLPNTKSIVIEKILGQKETVVPSWPVDGTSGYDFADHVTALFIDPEGAARLCVEGAVLCGMEDATFAALARQGKRTVLEQSFCAELDHLAFLSLEVLDAESPGHDLSELHLRRAWTWLTVALPVYRTYIDEHGASEADRDSINAAAAELPDEPESRRAVDILRRVLLDRARTGSPWLVVAHRWQQLCVAAMAKGSEDTATYQYPGLLARSEVGGDPDTQDDALDGFHHFCSERAAGLNATSTHDSKRNEDARYRLAVLSEADSQWMVLVRGWQATFSGSDSAPHRVEQLAIFQSLLCLWTSSGDGLDETTLDRIVQHAIKAARESKICSSWTEPNQPYEDGIVRFVHELHEDAAFRREMTDFTSQIERAAVVNSLAGVLLKVCAPGVPDFYQGTELLEATLTDPDNRRPVDFAGRAQVLTDLPDTSPAAAKELLSRWHDGHIKMYVTRNLLQDRKEHADLYLRGTYEPLSATTRHVLAFRRSIGESDSRICVVPRLSYRLSKPGSFPTGSAWETEALTTPPGGPTEYREILTGRVIEAEDGRMPLPVVLDVLPIAVLRAKN